MFDDGRSVDAARRLPLDPCLAGVDDEAALALAATAPGPALWAALTALPPLSGPADGTTSDAVLVEAVAAAERLAAGAAALGARALAALDARWRAEAGALAAQDPVAAAQGRTRSWTDTEVGARLRLTPGEASARVWRAGQLAGPRAAVLAALDDGLVDAARASVIVDRLGDLPETVAAAAEARVLPTAGRVTLRKLGRDLADAILAVDADGAEERAEARRAERGVRRWAEPEATACAQARGPADAVETIFQALDARARSMRGAAGGASEADGATLAAWRFDALHQIALDVLEGAHGPVARTAASRPVVHVTVPATTLLGLDDAPGVLRGHGSVPSATVRRIAQDATWRRILTDPCTGVAVATEEQRYRPSPLLAELVAHRHATCAAPGCEQPAWRGDADHLRPWPQGPTSAANLHPLCRYHHLVKHSARGMRAAASASGSGGTTWTTRTGHTYERDPDVVDQSASPPGEHSPPADASPPGEHSPPARDPGRAA